MIDSTDDNAAHNHRAALRIALAFASAGLQTPAPGIVCNLGLGVGAEGAEVLSLELAQRASPLDRSMAAFCARGDLPDFDIIVLHQPWSCLSSGVQAVVVDFVRRKLRVGGVFTVSYHCQPGWAPLAPLRSLLTQTASRLGTSGANAPDKTANDADDVDTDIDTDMIDQVLDFSDSLLDTSPVYFSTYPHVAERLRSLRGEPKPALARDYFGHWQPLSFANMADLLGEAKLSFACPVEYLDHNADRHLTGQQQALLAELTDPVFAESVRDLMVNRSFRSDYWVKGARPLSPLQTIEAKQRPSVVLATQQEPFHSATAAPPRGAIHGATHAANHGAIDEVGQQPAQQAMHTPVQASVLTLMADQQPRTIGELAATLQGAQFTLQQVFDAVLVLVDTGQLALDSA